MTTKSQHFLTRLKPRALLATAGVLAAIGTGTYLATPNRTHAAQGSAPAAPPAPKVTVAPVEQQLVTDYEELTGHVDATETVELRARVSGHLEEVHFQAGQLVQKGDVLFVIDPRWYQAQFDLATARADVAGREAARAEKLLAASAISSEEAEARRAAAAEARAALETAKLDLEHTEVRAPIAGRVSRAFVTSGNLVSGSPGNATLLTTIVTVGEAYVYADLDEATLLKFNRLSREGRILTRNGRVPVDLQLADEDGFPRHGFLESADNRVNPATGSLALRLVFPNDDGALVPGLFARVRLPVSSPQPALLVSERAIGTDQSQKFVLAVSQDNTVAYRTVKLGSVVDGKRVVREGLKPGDTIIVNGLQRVRPGMTVSPEPQAVAATAPTATQPTAKLTALR
ncbi:MAG TPA: efflux RND transporter periplasmic adaptor subunit [Candidatus Didemnitutus sp.]|nr:efflux RND transporter periplasmic adaptor subunit [Candidatus Didemnitutus sp.]